MRPVLLSVMRSLWRALDANTSYVGETYRAAQLFFSMLDPAIVFSHLASRIQLAGMG